MSRQLVVRTGLVSTQRLVLPRPTPLLPVTAIRHLAAKGKKKEKEKKGKTKAASRPVAEEGGGDDGGDDGASAFDLDSVKEQLAKASAHLQKSYDGLQTGRASPALLDGVMVDPGGGEVPLSSIAKVLAQGPQMLTVSCYQANAIAPAAKAIERLPLGLRAEPQGKVLRVAVPRPTQECAASPPPMRACVRACVRGEGTGDWGDALGGAAMPFVTRTRAASVSLPRALNVRAWCGMPLPLGEARRSALTRGASALLAPLSARSSDRARPWPSRRARLLRRPRAGCATCDSVQ